jgi:hypothetical protein
LANQRMNLSLNNCIRINILGNNSRINICNNVKFYITLLSSPENRFS